MTMPPKTKIFVGRLPEHCKSQDLRVLFEQYGKVVECDVLNRYGFVHMSTEEEADAAIKALNNVEFQGARISVEQSTGKKSTRGGRGGMRGGRGGGRGMPMPMRGGIRMPTYDRRPIPPPARNGYDYEYDYYDRRGPPMPERRAPPPARDREMMYRMWGDWAPASPACETGPCPAPRDRARPYPDPYDRRPMPPPPERRPLPPPPLDRGREYPRMATDLYSRRSPPPRYDPYEDPYMNVGPTRRYPPPPPATREPPAPRRY